MCHCGTLLRTLGLARSRLSEEGNGKSCRTTARRTECMLAGRQSLGHMFTLVAVSTGMNCVVVFV